MLSRRFVLKGELPSIVNIAPFQMSTPTPREYKCWVDKYAKDSLNEVFQTQKLQILMAKMFLSQKMSK